MKCIFLDDERDPKDVTWLIYPEFIKDWIILRNYDSVIDWINLNGLPDFISFDNDLGDMNGKEGYHVAHFITAYCMDKNLPFPHCAVHSKNPIAASNIVNLIESFNKAR